LTNKNPLPLSHSGITNIEITPPELEAGTLTYTINDDPFEDIGYGFVCRTDSLEPGVFNHHYYVTNVDLSGLSDTNLVVPIAEGDVVIQGYTDDVTNIEGTHISIMVDPGDENLVALSCSACEITMTESEGLLSGTFSGLFRTIDPLNPNQGIAFFITDGAFDVPLIELDCN